ncbi:hypothetical protein GGP96_003078 [Salinibacter ruber]|uniref:Uncharacterized protein n=1 Tax=Salinibacter ruber TaxID=146919 RepID=A0A9X2ZLU7_9BACT|nr:hypothetical protein [Salinibacter ruber]MCS4152077.1 hypothetical protein [Salinibacter ruber]MCS4178331.1 hypothetical protein [Salinibacter ruber]
MCPPLLARRTGSWRKTGWWKRTGWRQKSWPSRQVVHLRSSHRFQSRLLPPACFPRADRDSGSGNALLTTWNVCVGTCASGRVRQDACVGGEKHFLTARRAGSSMQALSYLRGPEALPAVFVVARLGAVSLRHTRTQQKRCVLRAHRSRRLGKSGMRKKAAARETRRPGNQTPGKPDARETRRLWRRALEEVGTQGDMHSGR